MKIDLLIPAIFLLAFQSNAQVNMNGQILDAETNEGVPGARIYVPDLGFGTNTKVDGSFVLNNLPERTLLIQISAPAFETITEEIDFSKVQNKNFLKHSHIDLDEILISNPASRLQNENIMGIEAAKMKKIKNTGAIGLAEGLASISGIDILSTGSGIGKPVIRGLQGNRIVTYADGVRIENQQFGADHGIGIGDLGIAGVEIIKGPGSLLYGADALGGVIYFVPDNYASSNSIEAYAESGYNSATFGTMNELGFKVNKRVKLNLAGSYNSFANYQLPTGLYVKNSNFDEKNIKASFGFNTKNWVTNVRYSYLQNNFGITEDSTTENVIIRSVGHPYQQIDNQRFSTENIFYLKNSKLKFTLGYSSNVRLEFEEQDSDHIHSKDEAALNMELSTGSYDLKWHKALKNKKGKFIAGVQGLYQSNINRGKEILIPDAKMIDAGLFVIYNHTFGENLNMQFGKRLDFRAISAEGITDTTLNYSSDFIDDLYGGMTISAGLIYSDENNKLRFNMATGFRAPNTSELASFGVHSSSLRFEIGSSELRKEQNLQFDLEFESDGDHLKFAFNPFFNSVKDYIYLDLTNTFINGLRVYQYKQDDAFLMGWESGIHLHPHGLHWLHIESNYAYVQAKFYEGGNLPLIPPANLNSTIRVEFDTEGDYKLENIYISHRYRFSQVQLATEESLSPDYHLFDFGLMIKMTSKGSVLKVSAGIRNVFNTSYVDHLSRFKDFGIPAMGRNFFFSLKLDLNSSLDKENKEKKPSSTKTPKEKKERLNKDKSTRKEKKEKEKKEK